MFKRILGKKATELKAILLGDDITEHYLDTHQKKYRIFRYKATVYAVEYDTNKNPAKAVEYVPMWISHNKEAEHKKEFLKAGREGSVYSKTEHKAVKIFEDEFKGPNKKKEAQDINLKLLRQKFLLHQHKIDTYFVIGLHNTKERVIDWRGNKEVTIEYVMPKIKNVESKDSSRDLDVFIHALKKANELGLSHPDYCQGPAHINFDNEFCTSDGIKLFDLDIGFEEFSQSDFTDPNKTDLDKLQSALARDQWLLVYNHKKQGESDWSDLISEWYYENKGQALSNNPRELLKLFEKKEPNILLPADIVAELRAQVAKLPKLVESIPPNTTVVQTKDPREPDIDRSDDPPIPLSDIKRNQIKRR